MINGELIVDNFAGGGEMGRACQTESYHVRKCGRV